MKSFVPGPESRTDREHSAVGALRRAGRGKMGRIVNFAVEICGGLWYNRDRWAPLPGRSRAGESGRTRRRFF